MACDRLHYRYHHYDGVTIRRRASSLSARSLERQSPPVPRVLTARFRRIRFSSLLLPANNWRMTHPNDRLIPDPALVDIATVIKTSSLIEHARGGWAAAPRANLFPGVALINEEVERVRKKTGNTSSRPQPRHHGAVAPRVIMAPEIRLARNARQEKGRRILPGQPPNSGRATAGGNGNGNAGGKNAPLRGAGTARLQPATPPRQRPFPPSAVSTPIRAATPDPSMRRRIRLPSCDARLPAAPPNAARRHPLPPRRPTANGDSRCRVDTPYSYGDPACHTECRSPDDVVAGPGDLITIEFADFRLLQFQLTAGAQAPADGPE